MLRVFLLLPLYVFLNSCATCWRGGEALRAAEVQSLQAVTKEFREAKAMRLHRGLAHPQRDKEVYARQLREVEHVEIKDFHFYRKPEVVSADLLARVVDLYCDADSHQALAAPKTTCHGFHPDYALVWGDAEEMRVLQICYGCHEWKFFGPGGTLYTDINEPVYFDQLMKWLPPKS